MEDLQESRKIGNTEFLWFRIFNLKWKYNQEPTPWSKSPWEADIRSANQGIPQLVCSMKIRYVGFEILMSVTEECGFRAVIACSLYNSVTCSQELITEPCHKFILHLHVLIL
jgi:hypothetical protein